MSKTSGFAALLGAAALGAGSAAAESEKSSPLPPDVARGRYLVQIGGCNDCHTAGYISSAGQVEEKLWLLGDKLGWSGPWGTTYAPNLRLTAKDMTAEQFMTLSRSELRPPMPWFSMRDMKDEDVKAIYAYLKHLGPAGERAPAYLPPGQKPKGPVVLFPEPPPGAPPPKR
jgi:mono/diheme cytochrome c family protein